MAYEYDMKNLITKLSGVWVESEKKEILKELQEVYRKAKAWEEFKEEKIKRYMGLRTLIMKGYGDALDTYYLGVFSDELKQMDKLDGTNEFSNLLSDLEDE